MLETWSTRSISGFRIDIELCFRIRGVPHPEAALSQALELYALGRRAAGLKADDQARASLAG